MTASAPLCSIIRFPIAIAAIGNIIRINPPTTPIQPKMVMITVQLASHLLWKITSVRPMSSVMTPARKIMPGLLVKSSRMRSTWLRLINIERLAASMTEPMYFAMRMEVSIWLKEPL